MRTKFLALALLLLVTGCSKYDHNFELGERSFGRETLQKIEHDTEIGLPADARGLNFFYQAPIDPAFAAKIEISAASQTNLLRQLSEIEQRGVQVSGTLGPRFKWWTPAQGKVLIERQRKADSTYLHVILVEDQGRTILYLEWSAI
jgi:hypothetical protein